MVLPGIGDVGKAFWRGLGGFVRGIWPVPLALAAILVPILRGSVDREFLLLEVALLVAFSAIAQSIDFGLDRSQTEDEQAAANRYRRKVVSRLFMGVVALSYVALVVAVVGWPFEPEDERSRTAALLLFLSAVVIAVVPVVTDRVWGDRRRRLFVYLHLMLASVAASLVFAYLADNSAVSHSTWHKFVWAFFLLVLVTAVLRLVLYADTWIRALVAVVFAAEIARLFWIAFVPSDLEVSSWDLAAPVALFILLLADGWVRPSRARRRPGWLRSLSVGCAMTATTALTIACVLATFGKTTDEQLTLEVDSAGGRGAQNYEALAPGAFAAAFSPVLLFPEADRWEPIRVEEFVEDAVVSWSDGTFFDKDKLDGARCPGTVPSPCLTISIACPIARESREAPGCDRRRGFRAADAAGNGHAPVYVRILDAKAPRDITAGELAIDAVGKYRADVRWLLQYWYFYYYDHWTSQSLFGEVSQGHEGDWEAVTVGLGDDRPLFVAFSAHCGGTWVPWEDVKIKRASEENVGAHPVVVVAAGSQATYPGPSADVMPDWAGCLPIRTSLSLFTVGLNVEEHVGAKYVLESRAEDIRLVSEARFPMNVPARWGARNGDLKFESEFGKRMNPARNESGPVAPALQPLWSRPLHRIFCDPAWHPDAEEEEC